MFLNNNHFILSSRLSIEEEKDVYYSQCTERKHLTNHPLVGINLLIHDRHYPDRLDGGEI